MVCTGFLESRLRCPYVVSKAHDESWWDCADRITRLRYGGHNSIIVFNYYQKHEGTLYYYYPNCVFLKSVFLLIASFFADIFASCVVSVSFEIRLLRVHPFSLDESFVSLCLCSRESHDARRHEIVVTGLQKNTSDTSFIFWTHLLFEEHRSDKHLTLFRSTDIVQFASLWSIPERIKLRSFPLMQWRNWMNLSSYPVWIVNWKNNLNLCWSLFDHRD